LTLFNDDKLILDLCGGTGSWSKPYKENGYNVQIVDFNEWGENNFDGDIRFFKKLNKKVYGILSAPPCTHFAVSGARWWKDKGIEPLKDGLSIVDSVFRIVFAHKPKFWVMENPVGRLVHYIGKPKHIFNPCDYGDPFTKKTCLWGNFNIPKQNIVEPEFVILPDGKRMSKMHYYGFKNRKIKRSITPPGFAKAFYESNK
tara:strand:- start:46 stop:645 length:600 start_codon:yes stop_codon:yes gene_type:complete